MLYTPNLPKAASEHNLKTQIAVGASRSCGAVARARTLGVNMLSENAFKEMPTLANRWSNFRFSSGIQVYFWMQRMCTFSDKSIQSHCFIDTRTRIQPAKHFVHLHIIIYGAIVIRQFGRISFGSLDDQISPRLFGIILLAAWTRRQACTCGRMPFVVPYRPMQKESTGF